MGVTKGVGYDEFPKQGLHLGMRCVVCFHYQTDKVMSGTIVRNDTTDPGLTIIKLDNGNYVLDTECQYSPG